MRILTLLVGLIGLCGTAVADTEDAARSPAVGLASVPVPLGFDVVWDRRPHRVSRHAFLPSLDGAAGLFAFEGGTWANGAHASDDAWAEVVTAALRGGTFHVLETPRALLTGGRVEGRHGLFEYSATWELEMPASPGGFAGPPVAWIAGWDVAGESSFAETGVPLAGFSVAVEPQGSRVNDPQGSRLRVTVVQRVGAVPDRRLALPRYQASAFVRVVAGWLPEGVPAEALKPYSVEERRETGFEDEGTPWSWLCLETRAAVQREGLPLPQAIGFELEHGGRLPGRYLRGLRLASGPGLRDSVDNRGPITRRLERTVTKRGLLLSPAAGASLLDFRCDQGKANGGGLALPAARP